MPRCPLDKITFKIVSCVILYIFKVNFKLDHPKLRKMPWCMRFFITECWTKCLHTTKCTSIGLDLELTKDNKKCLANEYIMGKVKLFIFLWDVRFQLVFTNSICHRYIQLSLHDHWKHKRALPLTLELSLTPSSALFIFNIWISNMTWVHTLDFVYINPWPSGVVRSTRSFAKSTQNFYLEASNLQLYLPL
jgi:hypothetical protein